MKVDETGTRTLTQIEKKKKEKKSCNKALCFYDSITEALLFLLQASIMISVLKHKLCGKDIQKYIYKHIIFLFFLIELSLRFPLICHFILLLTYKTYENF